MEALTREEIKNRVKFSRGIEEFNHKKENVVHFDNVGNIFRKNFEKELEKVISHSEMHALTNNFEIENTTIFMHKVLCNTYGYDITTRTGILVEALPEKADGVICIMGVGKTVGEIISTGDYVLSIASDWEVM